MKKRFIIFASALMICSQALIVDAHPGRTDASGGHRDNKNRSGLGPYHYHCGGHPAHLHTNGCPYQGGGSSSSDESSATSQGSGSSNTQTQPTGPSKESIEEKGTMDIMMVIN